MKKILVGFIMDGKSGGLDRYLLNFLKAVHSDELQIDFLTNEIDAQLQEKLKQYHSSIYEIANLHHPLRQYRQVCKIIKKGQYDVIYLNISTAIDCVAAFAAKKCGVKKRVLHCHASGNDCANPVKRTIYNTIHYACRLFFYKAGTQFYGASRLAGEWAFPKKVVRSERFQVILSGIDAEKFGYSPEVRQQVRTELGIRERFAVGHAGNFLYVKNHRFLVKMFREFLKQQPDAVLILVGKGEEEDAVRELIAEYNMEKSVMMLGWRSDVDRLLQAMDAFVLPSHFEGLSMVSLEAQSARLLCLLSDKVPEEVKISSECYFLPLKKGEKVWAEFLYEHKSYVRENVSILADAVLFDVKKQEALLKNICE